MRVLISGGTGFIGSAIARRLLKTGHHEISILSRNPDKAKEVFKGQSIRAVKGDVTQPQSLEGAFEGIDAVFQCVQFPNQPIQDPKKGYTYEKYDAEGTENLCNALKKSNVKRVIYISGAGTSPEKTQPWYRAKLRGEAAVRGAGREFVILRPSWVYGPGDHSLNRFIQFAKLLPFMPVIGDGKYRISPLFIDDLAEVCLKSLEMTEANGKTFEVGGPQVLTMNEIEKKVLEVLGKNKPLLHQPKGLMKLAGSLAFHTLPTPPLSSEAIDFITADIPTDSGPCAQFFSMKFLDLETAMKTYTK